MENWDMIWPVGILVVVVMLAIIDAFKRAVSVSREDESAVEGDGPVIKGAQSASVLIGTKVDFMGHTQGAGYVMKNPTAKSHADTVVRSARNGFG